MNNPFDEIDSRLSNIENLLLDIKHNPTSQENEESLLTVEECAVFLKISKSSVYGLIHKRELPVLKKTKRCYFLKSEIIQYLKRGRKKTKIELKTEASSELIQQPNEPNND